MTVMESGRAESQPELVPDHCVLTPLYDDDDVVLLVGAGASRYLGLPALDDILREARICTDDRRVIERIQNARAAIEAGPDRYTTAVFEELIARLRRYLEITTTIRTDQNYNRELGMVPHDVSTLKTERKWKEALTACYRTIIQEYGPSNIDCACVEFETMLELLIRIAVLNSGRLHVYTTNYDCSFQVLASNSSKVSFLTHIDNQTGDFRERWYHAVPGHALLDVPSVFVHRLHGCIAWFTDERRPFRVEEVFGAGRRLEIHDDDLLHKMCIKLITSQSLGTNPAFFLSFEEFANHLKSTKVLLVWGHSFRDIEVLRSINNALLLRKSPFDVVYIDPFLGEDSLRFNIHRTLGDAPVQVSRDFRLWRVPWIPSDGSDALLDSVMRILKERIENYV